MMPAARVFAVLAICAAVFSSTGAAQQLRSPVTCDSCVGYFYYFDHGLSRDYDCGNSTYDGHSGSDYSLRFGNLAIDNNHEVVAMAAGTVVKAEDGYYDRCTACGGANCGLGFGDGFANHVVINHGPNRVIYGHMKMGSIAVAPGDTVECGQVIGFIGSSGCSTGAHLHIEPSDAESFGRGPYRAFDAYAGECSPTPASLFVDQGAYETLPSAQCDDGPPVPTCPPDTYAIWTCNGDNSVRRRCLDGVVTDEPCPWGCTVMAVGTDDVCALPPDADGDASRADVDCDETRADVHPGAVDTCGDGVDQDCSGADAICPAPVTPPPAMVPPAAVPAEPVQPGASTGSRSDGIAGQPVPAPAAPLPPQPGAAGSLASVPVVPTGQTDGGNDDGGCAVVTPNSRRPRWLSWFAAAVVMLALCRRRRCRHRGA